MKTFVVWATAGLFALSLQGSALAQKEEKASGVMTPPMEAPAPMSPAEKPAEPEKIQKTSNKKTQKAKTQKTSTKKAKPKKAKPKVI